MFRAAGITECTTNDTSDEIVRFRIMSSARRHDPLFDAGPPRACSRQSGERPDFALLSVGALTVTVVGIFVCHPAFVRCVSADSTQRKREDDEIAEKTSYGASREPFLTSLRSHRPPAFSTLII